MVARLCIDLAERRVVVDGVPARLRPKSFDLLAVLASRPGHLFSADFLMNRIWTGRSVSPGVLAGCIREIRRILTDAARAPEWIQTVPGTGYRLLQAPELSGSGVTYVNASATADPTVGAWRTDGVSVAVLPFAVRVSRKFPVAQALTRDIAVGLARTRWLTVAASASAESVLRENGRKASAETLKVGYLVEGDLHEVGGTLVLQVILNDTRTDRILWADRMTGHGKDVAQLMENVCDVIVSAIEREIASHEQKRAMIAPVRGIAPWLGLHRGMNLLQRQDRTVLATADATLQAAARADPACARIAAARSWHAWQELFFGLTQDREAGLRRARDLALESIDLDAQDPLGHWSLGRVQWLSGDLNAAAENLERAVLLNPSFAIGHYSLGYTLYLIGRETEALQSCNTAIRLSPLDPMAFAFHCIKAHLLCFAGEKEQALHHARRIADHPNVHAFALAVAAWVNEICGDRPAGTECLGRIRHAWPGYSRQDYMAALFHQSPWYPAERKRAIERAFDRLGF